MSARKTKLRNLVAALALLTSSITSPVSGALPLVPDESQLPKSVTPLISTPAYTPIVTAQSVTAVVTGYGHTCALTSGGGVKCWGLNDNGQLGDGTTGNRITPVNVTGLTSGVTALAAGGWHTCVLTIGGAVKCWGRNDYGQLGDGTTANRLTPVNVSGLISGITAITVGGWHTCALTSGGGAKCWGRNDIGQLGDGTATNRLTPINVSGLTSGVAAIAAGGGHSCALTSGGGVKCWGRNFEGQLGDGTTVNRFTPVNVSGLTSGGSAVVAGYGLHTCALTSGGGVKCWGLNDNGQVGDGTTANRLTPVNVSGLTSGVAGIAVGSSHTCVLTGAGGVKCWGGNGFGELGDGTTTNRLTPVNVSGLTSGGSAVVAGVYHTCAPTSGGGVKCWGGNYYGQIGDGTTTDRYTPVDVVGLESSFSISHIEVTQAIQDTTNSVPLIAGKPTFVRVYVDCGAGCSSLPNVTGGLQVSGSVGGISLLSSPKTAYHVDNWTSQRDDLSKTFNFALPIRRYKK